MTIRLDRPCPSVTPSTNCWMVSAKRLSIAKTTKPEYFELDRSPLVAAWVKNDHLGFEITYSFRGIIRKFRPDYLVRLANRKMLVLEVKGQDNRGNVR